MQRSDFLRTGIWLSLYPILSGLRPKASSYSIRLLRHATLIVEMNGVTFMVDPMLSPKDAMDPIQNAGNDLRIPMSDLPIGQSELREIISQVDAILLTHTHRDHWDQAAQDIIDKAKTILCQPSDIDKIKGQGFTQVIGIEDQIDFKKIKVVRTGGQHGTGDIGKRMGPVSGYVLKQKKQCAYIAGDTIWCDEVKNALNTHHPETIILNAGGAQFNSGGPITMTPADITQVREHSPSSKIVAVHMDTVNHCLIKRKDLRQAARNHNFEKSLFIPEDGESIKF